jgi:ATP-dependent protease Clp ATPase subunit
MARSDLLLALVRSGSSGDKQAVRATAEAIIAEERAKQHNVLADRLTKAIHINGNGVTNQVVPETSRSRDFMAERVPRRRLEDLFLPVSCRLGIDQLIEEQQRADILRAHSLEPRHRLLLVGPPGNGKTSLAEAIAEALGVSFFVVHYETIIGSYLGETASRLKRVFDYARTTPCVLFFDEFDAIGKGGYPRNRRDQARCYIPSDADR